MGVLRKAAAAVVVVALVVALSVLWSSPTSEATAQITPLDVEMASWINAERTWNGVARIPIDGDLTAQAQLQAERMAACGCAFHSSEGEMYWWMARGWWGGVGENVAGTSGQGIFALFGLHLGLVMSEGHRANMLNPTFDAVGLAARTDAQGRTWVAQFYGAVP